MLNAEGIAGEGRPAEATLALEEGGRRLRLAGEWSTPRLGALEDRIEALQCPAAEIVVEAEGIEGLDTGGAWLLQRLLERLQASGCRPRLDGLRPAQARLLALVAQRYAVEVQAQAPQRPGLLERIGRSTWEHLDQAFSLLAFIGEVAVVLLRACLQPRRIRWRALTATVEHAGVYALPIVALLSFLLGIVIAYQGGMQLRIYGANIFIVELVSLTMLRELAPMMTAIIVAGRTGSAYTAEIGTMQVTEEVDAMRTIGIAPMDLLVLPRVLGLMIALPLLTLVADVTGVAGGMVMASAMLDVHAADFVARIPHAVSLTSFLIGLCKAPVFAAIIAVVGCFQGYLVRGGAEAVGRRTTVSVVQSIFLVIVADAGFSVLFSWLKI